MLEHGKVVAEIPNAALTDDAPLYRRPLERWEPPVPREVPDNISLGQKSEFTDELKRLLASPNICSKRWVFQQYDSMVQINTVEGPGARWQRPLVLSRSQAGSHACRGGVGT